MTPRTLLALLAAAALVLAASPAGALTRADALVAAPEGVRPAGIADWADAAIRYVKVNDLVGRGFRRNGPMRRAAFRRLMRRAFGGGYSRSGGNVRAWEVDRALVRALGKGSVAVSLSRTRSPSGWDPRISARDGFEIVARKMGLRYDRPTNEEAFESSAGEAMLGADVAYGVWKAKTAPGTWGADELTGFSLPNVRGVRRAVVRYAFNQVGKPYIWGGEWMTKTPSGYPYGAQAHGGADCSGFVWYVMRRDAARWHPKRRPYRGWSLADRSSSQMAAGTRNKIGFRSLRTGDLMFFADGGRRAGAAGVYHVGLYLGRGWMIDSAGGQAGVALTFVGRGSWYRDQFVWGRRLIR